MQFRLSSVWGNVISRLAYIQQVHALQDNIRVQAAEPGLVPATRMHGVSWPPFALYKMTPGDNTEAILTLFEISSPAGISPTEE